MVAHAYLLSYWSSLAGLVNRDENPCLDHLSSLAGCGGDNVRTLFLLEGVAAEEVDLVVGAFFISCNGSVVATLFCTLLTN